MRIKSCLGQIQCCLHVTIWCLGIYSSLRDFKGWYPRRPWRDMTFQIEARLLNIRHLFTSRGARLSFHQRSRNDNQSQLRHSHVVNRTHGALLFVLVLRTRRYHSYIQLCLSGMHTRSRPMLPKATLWDFKGRWNRCEAACLSEAAKHSSLV